jgi:hypothetical protein
LIDIPDHQSGTGYPEIVKAREDKNPILLLYPIDKDSPGRTNTKGDAVRWDLNANHHVLGMGFMLPGKPLLGEAQEYVVADIEKPEEMEDMEAVEEKLDNA